jgi:hypothetical protein
LGAGLQERAAHILMQRIKPQPYEAYVYRRGESSLVQAICELGIFSVYVRCAATPDTQTAHRRVVTPHVVCLFIVFGGGG